MTNVIYSKFNTHRIPQYRICTSIVEDSGKRFVWKRAMDEKSKGHIKDMAENYGRLSGLYTHVTPIPCEYSEDGIFFPYLKGKPIDSFIDYKRDSLESIKAGILKIFGIIFSYKEDKVKNGLVSPANIDSIISNFISSDGRVYLIDYEWVEEEKAPVAFLQFRSILYVYKEHEAELKDKIDQDGFIKMFGFSQRQLGLFYGMENAFQCQIHGRNCKFIYSTAYEKKPEEFEKFVNYSTTEIAALRQRVLEKEAHVFSLDVQVAEKNKVIGNYDYVLRKALSDVAKRKEAAKSYFITKALAKKDEEDFVKMAAFQDKERELEPELSQLRKKLLGEYDYWIRKKEEKYTYDRNLEYRPLISILVPVYNVESRLLEECVNSVIDQIYDNWELILVDDGSKITTVKTDLEKAQSRDNRIKSFFRDENGGISSATNTALEHAKGEFIALLDCDDVLSKNALYENVCLLNDNRDLDFIYSDEDKIPEMGKERMFPNFKPDYSPDTLLSVMYTCHLSVYRKSLVEKVGGFNSEYDGAQDYDLALRITENTDKIAHIPKVLYHWRMREGSTANYEQAKPEVVEATERLKKAALKRRGIMGHTEMVPGICLSRVVYDVVGRPLVSIIIPSKDHPHVLEKCLSTLVRFTHYRDYEIIVIDNGSNSENRAYYEFTCQRHDARYIYEPMKFNFSKMCNMGAEAAKGDYLLFLNDDIEIIDKEWLTRMLGAAQLPHVGAVGAKLYYPDRKMVQHMGVVNGKIGPGHLLVNTDDGIIQEYYRNVLDFDVIAVTGAAMLINRKKYEEVGGYNEDFAVNYNDVDFCFRLHAKGYYNVVRTDAKLVHHESLSRGMGLLHKDELFAERVKLYKTHPGYDGWDPFYNPNLNQFIPSFGINQDEDSVFTCEPAPEEIQMGRPYEMDFNIDLVNVNWDLGIFGWAVFPKNPDYHPVQLIMDRISDGKSFLLSTEGMVTDFLKARHGDVAFCTFAGFRTMTDRRVVEDGTYRLYIFRDNTKYDTKKIIHVGTENPESDLFIRDVKSEEV